MQMSEQEELAEMQQQMEELSVYGAVGGMCSMCKVVKLTGRFKGLGVCNVCDKLVAAAEKAEEDAKAAAEAAAAKAAAAKEKGAGEKGKAAEENEKEKERVCALWAEAFAKEEEEVRVVAWKAERALFHGLPKPAAADTSAKGKWRRWHDVGWVHYVGDKYPVEEEQAAGGGEVV